jgi:sulfatase modifying factor 1
MSELRLFLASLGLDKHAEAFERNEVTLEDLPRLTDADLQSLGMDALGPRRRLLAAVDPSNRGISTGLVGASLGSAPAGPASSAGTVMTPPNAGRRGPSGPSNAAATAYSLHAVASATTGPPAVQTIGRFQILKELGRGSMGVVYWAFDPLMRTSVALKVIHPDRLRAPEAVAQLAQEAARATQLTHPNLLRVNDFQPGPPSYIVMEYVDGETLTQRWVARQYRMTFDELRAVLLGVLEGLQFLHEKRLVHRDVKPDNVMVAKDGSVRVMDFGVSASLGEQLGGSIGAAGTLRYMPPEALRGEMCDARSDVYSVGMMAVQLLGGGFPFPENDVAAIRAWHLARERPRLLFEGGELIAAAIAHDPSARWPTAQAMAQALRTWELQQAAAAAAARTLAEEETRARAEAEARARAEAEAQRRAEQAAAERSRREAEQAAARSGAEAEARARTKAEARARPERDAAAEAEELARRPAWAQPWMTAWGSDRFGAWADLLVADIPVTMRWCPPGKFMMGNPGLVAWSWLSVIARDQPQHEVELTKGIWLAETPVTQVIWIAIMGDNPSAFRSDLRPVENVSWKDSEIFLARANKTNPSLHLRLPTEAEWEYACRAGTTGPVWAEPREGESADRTLEHIAWYEKNSGYRTHDVKGRIPNPWGLYDMLGNVSEWCSDFAGRYDTARASDPKGPSTGTAKVIRGGSWRSARVDCTMREEASPDQRFAVTGFRLAIEPRTS